MQTDFTEELISIVIPVYNAAPYVERTLKCIKAQTFKNWEVILVEDKSKDKSLEVIEHWLDKDNFGKE